MSQRLAQASRIACEQAAAFCKAPHLQAFSYDSANFSTQPFIPEFHLSHPALSRQGGIWKPGVAKSGKDLLRADSPLSGISIHFC
jgi:hypothetical protein